MLSPKPEKSLEPIFSIGNHPKSLETIANHSSGNRTLISNLRNSRWPKYNNFNWKSRNSFKANILLQPMTGCSSCPLQAPRSISGILYAFCPFKMSILKIPKIPRISSTLRLEPVERQKTKKFFSFRLSYGGFLPLSVSVSSGEPVMVRSLGFHTVNCSHRIYMRYRRRLH